MTQHRERASLGLYEYMKDNTAVMDVINAVYQGTASEDATAPYSIVRRRTQGSRLHTFQESYPVVDPKLSIVTFDTEIHEQASMALTHATDVIDDEVEGAQITKDGLSFNLLGLADGTDEPNSTKGDTNLLYTRLTYRYQIC